MKNCQLNEQDEATKLKDIVDLVNLVQHQINNPLAVVLGNVQFILLKNRDIDPVLLDRLQVIEKAALKIAEVNKRLSDVSSTINNK